MAVVIETTLGDFTVDLFTAERPRTCLNFLKLCKIKYYNLCLFHSVQHNFLAQTGDPTGTGKNGESVFGKIHGDEARFYEAEAIPKLRHTKPGLLSMVNCGSNMLGSQFFITLGSGLQSLDNEHCVFGEVAEGNEVLLKLNEAICDSEHRPYQDVRITHTIILDDPFDDPQGLQVPDCSPEPSPEALMNGRIAPDEELDETLGLSAAEIEERVRSREACAQATILEIVGDLPEADMAPPENVLFVCKLNPVTNDYDLEIIFSRFGKVKSCEVIRDKITGDSLQYAFVEFEDRKACEDAYFKMDNVLIDDRRIHVDFSQSVARLRWKGKGRGVEHIPEKAETKKDISGGKHVKNQHEFRGPVDHVKSREMKIHQHNHANDRRGRGREFDRNKNSAYKKDSSYKEIDKKATRNDKDKGEKRSRHSYDRSREVNRKHDEPRNNNEEDKRRREVDKDAKSSHSNEESKKYRDTGKDVKLNQEPRNRDNNEEDKRCRDIDKGLKIRHNNDEGKTYRDNRHISEEGKICRETDKAARNEEEEKGRKNVDKDITVKHVGSRTRQSSEEDKRLPREMKEGVKKFKNAKEEHREIMEKTGKKVRGESVTKEKRKKRLSSSLVQSRKKQKRSASSDSESSSSSDLTSSTDSSSSESSGGQSKARQKKHHKRPTALAKKSKKKLRLSKKGRRRWRKDSDTDSSSSFDSSDSGSRGRSRRNKKKRRRKDASSEEDSSSEHGGKRKKKRDKKKKKRKVTTKRKRKSSSSDTDDTSDTSSDSEDEKPSRKRRKKVIRKNKKNHTVKRKSMRRSESDELSSGDKNKKHRKVGSSASD